MNKNVVIDYPHSIEDEIEGFKLDAVDNEKNYTVARLKVCRSSSDQQPVLFYTQELSRNFKDPRDGFGARHLIKVFTPGQFEAAGDEAINGKFQDTLLAHKDQIPDYSPLTDIRSDQMNLFLDADTAQFIEDVGIRVEGLSDDFQAIESVPATPFLNEVARDASLIKKELAHLKGKYAVIKDQIADEFEQFVNPASASDEVFAEALAREKVSQELVQAYLSIRERMQTLQSQLGQVSAVVFNETVSKIRLPAAVNGFNPELAVAL